MLVTRRHKSGLLATLSAAQDAIKEVQRNDEGEAAGESVCGLDGATGKSMRGLGGQELSGAATDAVEETRQRWSGSGRENGGEEVTYTLSWLGQEEESYLR